MIHTMLHGGTSTSISCNLELLLVYNYIYLIMLVTSLQIIFNNIKYYQQINDDVILLIKIKC